MPQPGFFGKLPCTGDFVARGLPTRFRSRWDAWVTQHLAGRLKDDGCWPHGGLRFRLVSGGRVAAGTIVPSIDSAGRAFPLSLLLFGAELPAPDALDQWCDAALAAAKPALRGDADADELLAALEGLFVPCLSDERTAGLQVWAIQRPILRCDAMTPQGAIEQVFALSCC